MKKFIKTIIIYIKICILGKTQIKGYKYKKIKANPIVGSHYFKGYEIINPITNMVLYRKIKDWGVISSYNQSYYKERSFLFLENII